MKFSITVWGIGEVYNKHVNVLRYLEDKAEIEIAAITETGYSFLNNIDGWPVVDKNNLKNIVFDYLIIMREKGKEEVLSEALKLGIPRERILSYEILDIPDINFTEYISLKESRVSIISNNCWGGLVYKTLGFECISPFKNLSLSEPDFLKVVNNLRKYMEYSLEFSRFSLTIYNEQYPVMRLGDVEVHCNHDTEPEKAQADWSRRCKKINYENLFVEMFTENREIAEEFLSLSFSSKICFVPFESKMDGLVNIQKVNKQEEFWRYINRNAGIGDGSYSYNIVKLLLGDKFFSRCEMK